MITQAQIESVRSSIIECETSEVDAYDRAMSAASPSELAAAIDDARADYLAARVARASLRALGAS